jgi:hypothetical protein
MGRGGVGHRAPPCLVRRRLGWRMASALANDMEQVAAKVDRGKHLMVVSCDSDFDGQREGNGGAPVMTGGKAMVAQW